MGSTKRKLKNKIYNTVLYSLRQLQSRIKLDGENGYLTIFHDYEGKYAYSDKGEASYYGVMKMLDIEKKYGIQTTYNTVGLLVNDVPEIISRIVDEGHEIASHSYGHSHMTDLSKEDVKSDIQDTIKIFREAGIEIRGMRSPRGRWSFKQMMIMSSNKLVWSAENDSANIPYFIIPGRLIRFPVKIADYHQYRDGYTPDQVNQNFIDEINRLRNEKSYGAIGFHPWVQGESEERLAAYDALLYEISKMSNLKIKTFGQMYDLIKLNNNRV